MRTDGFRSTRILGSSLGWCSMPSSIAFLLSLQNKQKQVTLLRAESLPSVLTVTCLFFQARRPSLGYWDEGRLLLTFSGLSKSSITVFVGEGQNPLTLSLCRGTGRTEMTMYPVPRVGRGHREGKDRRRRGGGTGMRPPRALFGDRGLLFYYSKTL